MAKWALIALTSPPLGYANSWDFIRQSSCHGLWQDIPGIERKEKSPLNVSEHLLFVPELDGSLCQYTSDTLLGFFIASLHSAMDEVPFTEIALLRLGILLLLFLGLIWLSSEKLGRITLAIIFILVFSDFRVLLYLNTLYVEFTSQVALVSLSSLVFLAWTQPRVQNHRAFLVFFAFLLFFLGVAKEQFLPLAALLGLSLVPTLVGRRKKMAVLLLILSLPKAYYLLNDPEKGGVLSAIRLANRTDAILGAVLPAADAPLKALDALGLPPACEKGIGSDWYSPGLQTRHPCPEVRNLSLMRLPLLFLNQPETFWRPVSLALGHLRPLGVPLRDPQGLPVVFTNDPLTEKQGRYLWLSGLSLSQWIESLGADVFGFFNVFLMLVAMLQGLRFLMDAFKHPSIASVRDPGGVALVMGGGLITYSITSSVFGDGYIELQRHAFGVLSGYAFSLAGFTLWLTRWIAEKGGACKSLDQSKESLRPGL